MYEEFFNFSERPFSLTPDPSFLYMGKGHRMALTMLNYGIRSEAGITVISGEVGAGKTTLIHHVLAGLGEDITVGLIFNTHSAIGELLEWVSMAFELDYKNKTKTELYQLFSDFLIDQYAQNKRTVLVIDEAQNFGVETLEELRMLSNINFGKHTVLQLVLVGQPELLQTMRKQELRQLAQRVSVDYHIKRLKLQGTIEYIKYRIQHAGGDPGIFYNAACAVIHYYSRGIPRLINTLCDFSLVYAFAEEQLHVDVKLVLDVVRDKQKTGIFPMRNGEDEEAKKIRRLIKEKLGLDVKPILIEEDIFQEKQEHTVLF
ncbi:MAG: AAA family ATPase [Gammaproteobacteria bacterium]|nr:AAA family ATPase [Gammaproteobacteria bacterium]